MRCPPPLFVCSIRSVCRGSTIPHCRPHLPDPSCTPPSAPFLVFKIVQGAGIPQGSNKDNVTIWHFVRAVGGMHPVSDGKRDIEENTSRGTWLSLNCGLAGQSESFCLSGFPNLYRVIAIRPTHIAITLQRFGSSLKQSEPDCLPIHN